MRLQPCLKPGFGLAAKLILLAQPGFRLEGRQDRLASLGNDATAPGDDDRVADRLRNIGEQFGHFGRCLEVMLCRKASPVRLGKLPPLAYTDQNIVRQLHLAGLEAAIIRGHERQIRLKRGVKKDRLGTLLGGKTMTLKLNIDAPGKRRAKRGKPVPDKVGLTVGGGACNKPLLRTAGQQDQSVAFGGEAFERDHRIVASLDRQERLRVQPAERRITGIILCQKHHFAIAAPVADKAFETDNRLNARLHHDLREFQSAKHVLAVGDGNGGLRISPGQGRDLLNTQH